MFPIISSNVKSRPPYLRSLSEEPLLHTSSIQFRLHCPLFYTMLHLDGAATYLPAVLLIPVRIPYRYSLWAITYPLLHYLGKFLSFTTPCGEVP